MATRTFKIHLDDEVRRFKLLLGAADATYTAFTARVSAFGFGDADLVLKWKDSDGDLVTVAGADDFEEALSEQPTGPIRFFAGGPPASRININSSATTPVAAVLSPPAPGHASMRAAVLSTPPAPSLLAATGELLAEQPKQQQQQQQQQPELALEPVKAAVAANSGIIKVGDLKHGHKKAVKLPGHGLHVDPVPANKQHPHWADRFEVQVVGDDLYVWRVDPKGKGSGWGQQLELRYSDAPAPTAPTAPEPEPAPAPKVIEPVAHPHVVCDGTGQPLTGTRYRMAGQNYDLSEPEFAKLPEPEKQRFEMVLYPGAAAVPYEPVIHYGIVCDGSDATPIIGARFHRIGADFDLCQAEFAKLGEEEKRLFEIIVHPRRAPFPYKRPESDPAGGGAPDFVQMLQSVVTQLPGGDGLDIDLSQLVENLKQQIPGHHSGRGGRGGGCHRGGGWRQRQEVAAGEVLPEPSFGIGSFGPGVEQLQRFLIEHDLMDQAAVAWRAGLFGPWTRKAVSIFQKDNGIATEDYGRYDDATRAALLAATETAAASAPSAPVVAEDPAPAPPTRWPDELESLTAMGFADNEALLDLLDREHGQVDLVVAELLQ